jgi:hypothetical protein
VDCWLRQMPKKSCWPDHTVGLRVKSLAMSNVADVLDRATRHEREQTAPLVLKKMEASRKTKYQKLTQMERNRMNSRLAKVFNDMAEQGKQQAQ